MNRVPASDFKARCLALLDQVSETGKEIVVTKRGTPVARVVPMEAAEPLEGSVAVRVPEGELLSPIEGEWDAAGG